MEGARPSRESESLAQPRSAFSHYLPRLRREFYQGDAVVFWTLSIDARSQGWLTDGFHAAFREMMLHAAAREGLLCPSYCLMPDHGHLVWMGLRRESDQRNGMKFLRAALGPYLAPVTFQHQAHDHVLTDEEREQSRFSLRCIDYVLLNPVKAGLVEVASAWPYSGAVVPGYPRTDPFGNGYWAWMWKRYADLREPGLENRILPPREME
jgi:putative transposase